MEWNGRVGFRNPRNPYNTADALRMKHAGLTCFGYIKAVSRSIIYMKDLRSFSAHVAIEISVLFSRNCVSENYFEDSKVRHSDF